jgi:hypothetical protein
LARSRGGRNPTPFSFPATDAQNIAVGEPDARAGLGQDHFQCCLAAIQRSTAQIVAVQLDQIESVEKMLSSWWR